MGKNEIEVSPNKTKKSCQKQDSFQNINPNITLEIKSHFKFFDRF